jgi:SAM-dependent methyltransferase
VTKTPDNERSVWLASEADAYYVRNREALVAQRNDPLVRLLDEETVAPQDVLEVGCSNGWRLAMLAARGTGIGHPIRAVGVEPSMAAVADGRRLFGPAVELWNGHAAALPAELGQFDLVMLPFVLHWLARSDLDPLTTALGTLLKPAGLVAIADFHPDQPERVRYKHRAGLWTYKDDYGPVMARKLGMRIQASRVFDHRDPTSWASAEHVPATERCAVWLLGRR